MRSHFIAVDSGAPCLAAGNKTPRLWERDGLTAVQRGIGIMRKSLWRYVVKILHHNGNVAVFGQFYMKLQATQGLWIGKWVLET